MKRSGNRLVLLVGIFLAVVAFVLIAVSFQGSGKTIGPTAPPDVSVVVAAKDLPLGTKITADAVTTKTMPAADKPADSYSDTSMVIGQTVRQDVSAQQLITSVVLSGSAGSITDIKVPVGYVGIAVQVDQITGVGTLIKPGDHVDIITGLTGADKVPVVLTSPGPAARPTPTPRAGSPAPSSAPTAATFVGNGLPYNPTTVKVIVEGLQVLGTLLPPPTANTSEPAASGQTTGTSLNGQQEIVILAATPQQAEAIKFSQMDGTISLVLRATADCQAQDGTATPCPIIPTTGVTLRKMVDDFGVLPPQIMEGLMPTPYPSPFPSRLFPSPTPNPSGSVAPSASAKP